MTTLDLDPGRCCRAAVALADGVVRIVDDVDEPGVYAVSSFTDDQATYRVTTGPDGSCTCGDATYGGEICKHRLALVLYRGLEG